MDSVIRFSESVLIHIIYGIYLSQVKDVTSSIAPHTSTWAAN